MKPERTSVSGHAARRYLERVATEPADIPAVQRLIHHDVVCALREGRRSVAQPRWTVEHELSRRRKASLGCRFVWPADTSGRWWPVFSDTICECGHWYEEHRDREPVGACMAPGCPCTSFSYSAELSSPEAVADRGGEAVAS